MPPGSELMAEIHGESARWGPAEHLLALAVDVLAGANWQRGGGKGAKPKPIPRPQSKLRERIVLARLKDVAARAAARRRG